MGTFFDAYRMYVRIYGMRQKMLPLPFNGTERVILFPFNNISLTIPNPFEVRVYFLSVLNPF